MLGFGGPWDHGGGGERSGEEAALVEKRMVACLLCASWSLYFTVFTDQGHVEEFSFPEGTKLRIQMRAYIVTTREIYIVKHYPTLFH